MSISLIPESAPFNTTQRAWLNGFFAGLTQLPQNRGGSEVASVMEGMLGSDTANADSATEEQQEEFPWHDESLPIVDRMELAEGKPVERQLMAAMAQLDCGACGYVCQTYSEAIAAGEEKSLTLCSPGGKETSKMLKQVLKQSKSETSGAAVKANGSATATNGSGPNDAAASGYSRTNPYPASLLTTRNLNGAGSEKHTRHVELDLNGSGLTYEVGDSLGVYPTNCDELVGEIIDCLGISSEQNIEYEGEQLSLANVLCQRCDLTEVTDDLLELLAAATDSPEEKARLERWLEDGPPDEADCLDVLRQQSSATLEPAQFAASLATIKPRLYSISSSLKSHPGQVHLTIGRVAWQQGERVRKGVASTMFADRLAPSAKVRVFVQKSHGFRLPADPATPIIMVGPGTGVAPFRAFLQERVAQQATGRNWLFFGDQQERSDFLYREEIEQMLATQALTRVDTAFSRDQAEKVYVQNRMLEHASELWQWLSEGAYFYVCGDGKRMAVDVDRALREIIQQHAPSGSQFYEELKASGRYLRDVY